MQLNYYFMKKLSSASLIFRLKERLAKTSGFMKKDTWFSAFTTEVYNQLVKYATIDVIARIVSNVYSPM